MAWCIAVGLPFILFLVISIICFNKAFTKDEKDKIHVNGYLLAYGIMAGIFSLGILGLLINIIKKGEKCF